MKQGFICGALETTKSSSCILRFFGGQIRGEEFHAESINTILEFKEKVS